MPKDGRPRQPLEQPHSIGHRVLVGARAGGNLGQRDRDPSACNLCQEVSQPVTPALQHWSAGHVADDENAVCGVVVWRWTRQACLDRRCPIPIEKAPMVRR